MKEHPYFVYIVASRSRNVYVGVTNSIRRRVGQHKAGEIRGFTQRYNIDRLVHLERYQYVRDALDREKELKGWRREQKIALIERDNPGWGDLSEHWYGEDMKFRPEVFREALQRGSLRNVDHAVLYPEFFDQSGGNADPSSASLRRDDRTRVAVKAEEKH